MKKICHIISAFKRYDTRIFVKQCHALVDTRYQVYLLTNDSLPDEVIDGIKIISCNNKFSNRIKRIIYSPKIFKKKALEINADIYQIHDPELIPLGLFLKKKGKSVVYDAHEDFPMQILEKEWIHLSFRKAISFLADIYLQKNLKKFDLIISVTPHLIDKLIKINSQTFCITNYPVIENNDIINFTLDEYISRKNQLCYVGTVYKSSVPQNIIKALDHISNRDFLIVGPIDKLFKDELHKLLKDDNIKIIDPIPFKEVKKIYQKSTIGIAVFEYSPNLGYKEGSLGVNKIFEYMLFGLPVICTDFRLWRQIIEKYNCGILVNPNDICQIHEAITFLINNKEKAYQMGQNGRRAVLKEYNWASQEKIYLNLYKELSEKIDNEKKS